MGKRGELGMNFDLEYVNCDLCGKSATRIYAAVSYKDYVTRRPELRNDDDPILKNEELANYKFTILKCRNCGLIYVNPRLTESSLAKLYQEEYFSYYANVESEAHKKRQKTFECEIKELEKLTSKSKLPGTGNLGRKILDVGCGGGFFLDSLDNSWEKWGTEINPAAVKFAKNNLKLNVRHGTLKELCFPNKSFDVVKLRGLLEHLPDPIGELYEVYRILRKGGIIAVNTPNIGSICARIYKEKFRIVCPTAHIYYFSTKTLSLMLKKVGFKVVKVSYHYFDTPYASWRDPAKILLDLATFKIFKDLNTVSPPFYGNIVDIYALREASR